jgi:hypothetical protein
MRYEIEAQTDTASLLLFDPAALPGFSHLALQSGRGAFLEQLAGAGLACNIDTHGESSLLLHAYVDETIPANLWDHLREPRTVAEFQVPSGHLVLAGLEHAARDEERLSRTHPGEGNAISVRPGVYRLILYRTGFPAHVLNDRFLSAVPRWEWLLWHSMTLLIPVAIAAWIGLVVIFFTNVRVPFPSFLAPVLVLVFALPFAVRRMDAYASLKARYTSLAREYPALVARLEFLRADSHRFARVETIERR